MKIAVVTGASSGLGKEFVRQINHKYKTVQEIWIIARREVLLEQLKREISGKKIRVLPYDVTSENTIKNYKKLLQEMKPKIRVLVNCAGYGKLGLFEDIPYDDNIGMIDLNCKALTAITFASLPYMANPSNIIQVASSAGFMPQPRFSIYAASKSFVLSFSRSLNVELENKGIVVTAVCPGPVETEFFDVAEETGHSKFISKLSMAKADKVVHKALADASRKKDISVYGLGIKAFRILSKIFSHKIMMRIVAKM